LKTKFWIGDHRTGGVRSPDDPAAHRRPRAARHWPSKKKLRASAMILR
jgi:hypothetical protein